MALLVNLQSKNFAEHITSFLGFDFDFDYRFFQICKSKERFRASILNYEAEEHLF
jgi:hypothetical protein